MKYHDLHGLLMGSSSTRQYFVSLPVDLQMLLHAQNDGIRTAAELHRAADIGVNYLHHCKLSEELM